MAVVVGYVPTPEGRAALRWAADETRRRDTRLVVVSSPRSGGHDEPVRSPSDDPELRAALAELTAGGLDLEVRTIGAEPDPADDLLSVATEISAEVIVIGLRRRTPVGKLILGSNAQRILLDASCPVVAVKAEPPT